MSEVRVLYRPMEFWRKKTAEPVDETEKEVTADYADERRFKSKLNAKVLIVFKIGLEEVCVTDTERLRRIAIVPLLLLAVLLSLGNSTSDFAELPHPVGVQAVEFADFSRLHLSDVIFKRFACPDMDSECE